MEVFTEQFNMWNEMKLEVSVVSKKTYITDSYFLQNKALIAMMSQLSFIHKKLLKK